MLAALGHYHEPEIARSLLAAYRSAPSGVRQQLLSILCSRAAWASELLAAIARGEVAGKGADAGSCSAHRAIAADPALLDRLEAVWGKVPRVGSPEKKRRIAEIRGLLPEGDKGNAAARQGDLQGALRRLPQIL